MFKDKTCVITGSARGLGEAMAIAFAEKGANIVVSDILLEEAQKTANEIAEKYKVKTIAVETNVTDNKACKELAAKAKEEFGSLDIWVNNAGVIRDDLLIRMSQDEWNLVIDVNLKGTFNGTQAAAKIMMKQRHGKIVNISSGAGLMGNPGQANYTAAKAGVIGLTKTSAKELAARNITVNCICPGYIATDMTATMDEKYQDILKQAIPLKREGKPEDIAYAARWLASPEADFITGVILRVDGGMLIGM